MCIFVGWEFLKRKKITVDFIANAVISNINENKYMQMLARMLGIKQLSCLPHHQSALPIILVHIAI